MRSDIYYLKEKRKERKKERKKSIVVNILF